MCYASLAEKDFRKLNNELAATPWPVAFDQFHEMQNFEAQVGPGAMQDLLGLKQKPRVSRFRWNEDGRFSSYWFAPVVIQQASERLVVPMRYRIRPAGSKTEVPSKYNFYNARIESLSTRPCWKKLLEQNRAVIAIRQFFENIGGQEIGISPTDERLLIVAAIYDEWHSPHEELFFRSFAIITGPPPESVLAIGHQRCPVVLDNAQTQGWLSANNGNEALAVLKPTDLQFKLAA
ncbi:MAG: SOS response-associated peptidase [Gammaproteobacteria bacterium]|nr:SOS response-associated peptidase [Gammaproteobacteria bacterium]